MIDAITQPEPLRPQLVEAYLEIVEETGLIRSQKDARSTFSF
jgi:hypothetical protein